MSNLRNNSTYFLKDTALVNKENDAFHHEDYVQNLKTIILEHDPPYNIALIGKWGVGKSSIINLLKTEIEGRPEISIHEINAWKYENDSLKKAFLKNLYNKFNPHADNEAFKNWGESLRKFTGSVNHETETLSPRKALKDILPIIKTLFALWAIASILILVFLFVTDIINALFTANTTLENMKDSYASFKKNVWVVAILGPTLLILQDLIKDAIQRKYSDIHLIKPIETADEYEELFKKEIKEFKNRHPEFKKLVVIVDDLDRLTTKKVVAALDAIKAFVEINECIFIVTCDENILINALEKEKLNKSLDVDGELFLDKLFHFRVSLPPIIERDMSDYAVSIAQQEAPGLVTACNGQFQELIDILIHTDVSTPRQVKKILNTFANNLLIAQSRESDGRKLEDKLLTNEQGLRYLAKISVIQSDYNDIYNELIRDYSFLEDLLKFYQVSEDEDNTTKASIKQFFNSKGSSYQIKPNFEGLINFLTRTQHIVVDNVAPFIYLGQDTIGLNAGDEKQRTILQSMINGNEKPILEILEKANEKIYLTQAIIDVIKHAPPKTLPSVIKAATSLVNSIEVEKREFSNSISYRLNTNDLSRIRFWQLSLSDLLEIYFQSSNKLGIEKAILNMLSDLFTKNNEWKNSEGRALSSEEFSKRISSCLILLFEKEDKLPKSIKNKIKEFLNNDEDKYNFFDFENVHNLYLDFSYHFNEYFGLPFYDQLISSIENSDGKQYEMEMMTFYKIAPDIRDLDTNSFIQSIVSVISSSGSEYLLKTLELLNPIMNDIEDEVGSSILQSIIETPFKHEKQNEILSLVNKIPFDLNSIEDLVKQFDNFIFDFISDEDLEEQPELLALMETAMENSKEDFGIYANTFGYLIDNLLTTSENDNYLIAFNSSFSDNQRKLLFEKLKTTIPLNAYKASNFERLTILYSIFINEEKNAAYIEESMKLGIQEFRSRWQQNKSWANDFIGLFSVTSSLIDRIDIENLLPVLEGPVTSSGDTDITLKALKHLGKHLPENKIVSLRAYSIKYSETDASKMDAFEFLKATRNYATKENENLHEYVTFLINNFSLSIERFLDELTSKFSSIRKESLILLLEKASHLKKDVLRSKLTLIQNTLEKFFMVFDEEGREQLLINTIRSSIDEKIIDNVLLESLDDTIRADVLNKVLSSADIRDKNVRISLLKLCKPSINNIENTKFTNLLIDMFNEDDEDYIVKTSEILLNDFSDYRFNKEKRRISEQLYSTFRNVNLNVKSKLLEVSKVFLLRDIFIENLKTDVFTEKEKDLIVSHYNLRRKKKSIFKGK